MSVPSNALRHLSTAAAMALAAGTLLAVSATPAAGATTAAGQNQPPGVTHGACQYTATPDDPAVRPVSLPPDPRHTPDHGTALVTLDTNQGKIGLTLMRAQAPCTVQSFLHLVRHGFYDRTICHRLTAYPTLSV